MEQADLAVILHQARCNRLSEEKRAYRRDILILATGDEGLVDAALADLGLSDCQETNPDDCPTTP